MPESFLGAASVTGSQALAMDDDDRASGNKKRLQSLCRVQSMAVATCADFYLCSEGKFLLRVSSLGSLGLLMPLPEAIKIIDFATKKEIRVLKHVPQDLPDEEIFLCSRAWLS